MLRRKHFAQKNTSKGEMNTRSVSAGSSLRLNNMKRQQVDTTQFKRVPNQPQDIYIKEKQLRIMQCDVSNNVQNVSRSCANRLHIGGTLHTRVCAVHKKLQILSQKEYIEYHHASRCILSEESKKPMIENIICGYGSYEGN